MKNGSLKKPSAGTLALLLALSAAGAARAGSPDSPLTSDEVRAMVAEMLADAQTRSSLLSGEAQAGHNGSAFYLASPDGAFRLTVGGQLQTRYILNLRQSEPGVDDFQSGFQSARTRLLFTGTVAREFTFRVQTNFTPSGGAGVLEDAWVGWKVAEGVDLRFGQGITYFLREWQMGDWRMLAVERSLQAFVFGQARSQFVEAKHQRDDWRIIGTFSDGFRSANTDLGQSPADWALTARAEWKLAGTWPQLENEYSSRPGSALGAVVGAAVHYEVGPNTGQPGQAEQELFAWTGDVLVKGDGWNVMAATVGYSVRDEAGVAGRSFHDLGFMVQGGAFVADDVELFGRYDIIIPDGDRAADDTFSTITAGMNWYISGQAAKFSLQGSYFPDATANTAAGNYGNTGAKAPSTGATLTGVLPSGRGDQFAVLAQFQLLF